MEIKHKECFCPATIHAWELQPIAKYAREAWEFCNLYSKDRGRSRFYELLLVFEALEKRSEVQAYGFKLPDISSFRHWVETAPVLNNQELAKHSDDPVLKRALDWSLEMNRRAAEMVYGIPPFPGVRDSLEKLYPHADIVIVSATPREALEREWTEHHLMQYIHLLCAQEDGTKKECIGALKRHYNPSNILMLGDAPGDKEAAHGNGVLFYPIRPGEEIASWQEFLQTGADTFLADKYTTEHEREKIHAFDACLPTTPPWAVSYTHLLSETTNC